jgi:hypothetical protein
MKTVRVVVAASASAAGWLAFTPWPPSSRIQRPRVLKDKSHIPAATFAIAASGSFPHGHVCLSWDKQREPATFLHHRPGVTRKGALDFLATPLQLEVRVSTRGIGVRLISMSMTIFNGVSLFFTTRIALFAAHCV